MQKPHQCASSYRLASIVWVEQRFFAQRLAQGVVGFRAETVVLMAALPPALNVFVLGRQYDAWVEPASGSVLLGTLVSVATLTTVMWLVQHGVVAQLMVR